ncbi:MAG: FKBP-type peptidyl-prolyl cis-trans isomerase [Gammaproteobacteria bacterium]|nr:FKBP-type peptidyl-prolyl cis-trans isomerase [Gammaproteobacteria bacterium]
MKLRNLILGSAAMLCAMQLNAADKQLNTDKKQISYAIGVQIGQDFARSGLDLDLKAFNLAINDMLAGKEPRLNDKEIQQAFAQLREQQMKHQQKVAQENKVKGEKFLAENKKKAGIKELPSGVQYQVIKSGSGKKPKDGDTVVAHYEGKLIDGTIFDSSYKRGQPLTISINQVVKGWQDALKAMPVGAKWQVFIPPHLGYGARGTGNIPPNSVLIFDIELLEVK